MEFKQTFDFENIKIEPSKYLIKSKKLKHKTVSLAFNTLYKYILPSRFCRFVCLNFKDV